MSIDQASESSSQQAADERPVSVDPGPAAPAPVFAAESSDLHEAVRESSAERPRAGSGLRGEPLEFRILREGAPTRRLRLTGQRYTFGSGEGCSIRLRDLSLRPTHAVLLRDESRTLIRAYSVPIEINGVRTTEAELEPGDVVRLGPYRMELLSSSKADASSNVGDSSDPLAGFDPWRVNDVRPSLFGGSARGQQESSLLEDAASDDWVRQGRSAADELAWRKRLRQEVEQWRRRQTDCDQREYRCDQREADLRERESELWNRAESLYRREYRLQSQEAAASQLYDEFDKRQKELLRLREETRGRDENIRQREAEFQQQEAEYQRQLDDAQRQLVQSQQQASTAATAVEQMRKEFVELSEQISQISQRQQQLDQRDQLQRDEQKQLQQQLEQAQTQVKDQSSPADREKESAESKRAAAEARVEELTAQLDLLRNREAEDLDQQRHELEAKEQLVIDLRAQVDQLQKSLQNAQTESNQLRKDYEQACQSVLQLESLVQQSTARGDQDRESWTAEAEQLRASIDQLSIQLAQANGELSELTKTNQQLTAQLEELQSEREQLHREREQLQQDVQARPSNEAFAKLQHDLEETNKQFSQMLEDYQATQQRLELAEKKIRAAATAAEVPTTTGDASDDLSLWPETETDLCEGIAPASDEDSVEDFGWDGVTDISSAEPSGIADANELTATSAIDDRSDPTHDEVQEPTLASELLEQLADQPAEESTTERSITEQASLEQQVTDGLSTEQGGQPDDDAALNWDVEYEQESALGPWPDDEDYLSGSDDYLETGKSNDERLDPDDEDSIEAYMNRLLQRVQTGPEKPSESTASLASMTKTSESRLENAASTQPPTDEATASDLPDDDQSEHAATVDHDEPYLPRRAAPELSRDLSAMRQLANESADEAISYSVRTQTRDTQVKGMLSFVCAAGALLCGAACFHFVPGVVRYVAVAMTIIVAAVYVREGLQAMLEARRRLRLAAAKREIPETKVPAAENSAATEIELSQT